MMQQIPQDGSKRKELLVSHNGREKKKGEGSIKEKEGGGGKAAEGIDVHFTQRKLSNEFRKSLVMQCVL